jgi:hypothetical protein
MGRLADWLDKWEVDVAAMLRNIVMPEGNSAALVDADEVCFFGSVRTLPKSMEYLLTIGTPDITPEVYVVGMKNGKLIPPEIWYASDMRWLLENAADKLMPEMMEMMEICDDEGFTRPTAVKMAVVVSTGEAFTKYDFDPLSAPPFGGMTAADWAFDEWTTRVQSVGSAMKELKDAFERDKK